MTEPRIELRTPGFSSIASSTNVQSGLYSHKMYTVSCSVMLGVRQNGQRTRRPELTGQGSGVDHSLYQPKVIECLSKMAEGQQSTGL